jgi:hypothetical protein
MTPLIGGLLDAGLKVLDKVLPDPQAKIQAQLELMRLQQAGEFKAIEADLQLAVSKADIIKTEAASSHWLAANWRPVLMLTFGGLIVARWFGWAAPNLSEQEYLKLWDIVELGLGGYVIGRSVEKIAPSVAQAIKK